MKKIFLFAIALIGLTACKSNDKNNKYIPESVGNPFEVFVVAPMNVYRGAIGDSLKISLQEEVHMINFSEPSFDLYNLLPEGFKGININHRNLIFLQIGNIFPVAKTFTLRDKYSKPQLITVLEAPDSASMIQLIVEQRDNVKNAIEKEELSRFAIRATKYEDKKLSDMVKDMFDLKLMVPKGYKFRNAIGDDFLWISNELPESSQGLLLHDFPFEGSELNDSLILGARNKFVANVPGELPGGYMTTGYEFTPETSMRVINGRDWYVTKGFWRVENDFQGGPFVLFSTIDHQRKKVIMIDCYVYSPNPDKKQRNFLRQLEGIVETAIVQ